MNFPSQVDTETAASADKTAMEILKLLGDKTAPEPQVGESNAIYYVSGALARSELRQRNCSNCAQLLTQGKEDCLELEYLPNSHSSVRTFAEEINRGGLLHPTDLAFSVCLKSWMVFQLIQTDTHLKSLFLGSQAHRRCFCAIVFGSCDSDDNFSELLFGQTMCLHGHPVIASIVNRFFNCLMKNFIKELEKETASNKGEKKKKVANLQSRNNA